MKRKEPKELLNEFDFNSLLPKRTSLFTGRRFGKSFLTQYLFQLTIYKSYHLGELMFGYMSKKHQKMLNESFSQYIRDRMADIKDYK